MLFRFVYYSRSGKGWESLGQSHGKRRLLKSRLRYVECKDNIKIVSGVVKWSKLPPSVVKVWYIWGVPYLLEILVNA
jgi:hypothetical protein